MWGKKATQEQKDYYNIAYEWLYHAIDKVTPGATTKEIAEVWPSTIRKKIKRRRIYEATGSVWLNTTLRLFRASIRSISPWTSNRR